MKDLSHGGHLFGGTLLVAGTAIGGGMLALPVLTATGGFFPTLVIFTLCWLFMAATGLLLMEVVLWNKEEVNLISLAKMTLGMPGKIAAWILYLFMFYSLTIAYISGGGGVVCLLFEECHQSLGPFIFVLVFAPFVAVGAKFVDRLNVVLMGGLILSFLTFVVVGIDEVDLSLLSHVNWPVALLATPVMFTSFAYQGIVPTLTNYLGRHPKRVSTAIVLGSFIPLVVYAVWELLILGILPTEALQTAESAVAPLKAALQHPWLFRVGEFLAFFAVVTSFLGVTLGLLDFLADGLKVKKTAWGRFFLALLIFGPSLAVASIDPRIFLFALQYAGGLGSALLLGLLPILMVWRGRYQLKLKCNFSLFGGRITLSLLSLFILFEIIILFMYTAG